MFVGTIVVMAVICPTVTAFDVDAYREQLERVAPFAKRVHLDFMDGMFAPTKSPGIDKAWLPQGMTADLHIMYQQPAAQLAAIARFKSSLVVVHAEAEGDFIAFAKALHKHGIKTGVALLPQTPVQIIRPGLQYIDHILIFSGDLGRHGGHADLGLLNKVRECKQLKPSVEIGWDGGINADNAKALAQGGVDVLNVGGYIQNAPNPRQAYNTLKQITTP
jgi:ribulose-phosphate 3-epimerase